MAARATGGADLQNNFKTAVIPRRDDAIVAEPSFMEHSYPQREVGMFEGLKCARKGHLFVDSRSQPGMQTCVRCRLRRPFEGGANTQPSASPAQPTN
ncbi:MAG: hypothetical protein EON90_14880 [Brevundimonas sp.]|nr:MAG: hypothetical protein EON90_14880 [Brevundimonas sp.]